MADIRKHPWRAPYYSGEVMTIIRKQQHQRGKSYHGRWVYLAVTVTAFIVLRVANSILTTLNVRQESELTVRRTCFAKDNTTIVDDEFCDTIEGTRRVQNLKVVSLPTNENAVDANSQVSIREYITQKYSSPNDNGRIQKQRNVLISNLEYAYANMSEMLDRRSRFPSIAERVKIYMSNWYIPPCDDAARVPFHYSTTSEGHLKLTIQEISLVKNKQEILTDDQVIDPNHQRRVFEMHSHFSGKDDGESLDEVHFLDRAVFMDCTHIYCKDTLNQLLPSFDRMLQNHSLGVVIDSNSTDIPILYQFGDVIVTRANERKRNMNREHIQYPRIPVFQKVRTSKSATGLNFETDENASRCYEQGERRTDTKSNGFHFSHPLGTLQMEPIIFKVKTHRHYGKVYDGKVPNADRTPWEEKKNVAVFRGALTGGYTNGMRSKEAKALSVVDRCKILDRCWFTYTHASSTLIDAKLTEPFAPNRNIPRVIVPSGELEDSTNAGPAKQVDLYGQSKSLSMEELLQYKAIVMLEGNDISSGLKWALFSSSIVMMPEPTLTSWSMEEMLQPWVHYVPINIHKSSNGTTITTDAEEKMQWIIDNNQKALEIVKASTLWIADLILHPDERNDEQLITDEIARRYLTHFVPSQALV